MMCFKPCVQQSVMAAVAGGGGGGVKLSSCQVRSDHPTAVDFPLSMSV